MLLSVTFERVEGSKKDKGAAREQKGDFRSDDGRRWQPSFVMAGYQNDATLLPPLFKNIVLPLLLPLSLLKNIVLHSLWTIGLGARSSLVHAHDSS